MTESRGVWPITVSAKGWCFSSGGFAGHVRLMSINGAALDSVPPVSPVGMGKSTRRVGLQSVDVVREPGVWYRARVSTTACEAGVYRRLMSI